MPGRLNLVAAVACALIVSVNSVPPSFAQQQSVAPLSGLSDEERQALRLEIRAYLLENPEVIFEAIQILEAKHGQAGRNADRMVIEANEQALFDDGFSWVGGNPDGDVTVVEFLDYRCGYCKRAHPEVAELLERDPNIRLIIKEFPILGEDSTAAGRMALATLIVDPGKFRALSNELMGYRGNLTESVSYSIAESLGFDPDRLRAIAESAEVEEGLQANYRLAGELNINGTPGFVIGTEVIRGYLPADGLLSIVDQARREGPISKN